MAWAPVEFITSVGNRTGKLFSKHLKLRKVNIQLFIFFQNRPHKTGVRAAELPLLQFNSKEQIKMSEEFWMVSQIGEFQIKFKYNSLGSLKGK